MVLCKYFLLVLLSFLMQDIWRHLGSRFREDLCSTFKLLNSIECWGKLWIFPPPGALYWLTGILGAGPKQIPRPPSGWPTMPANTRITNQSLGELGADQLLWLWPLKEGEVLGQLALFVFPLHSGRKWLLDTGHSHHRQCQEQEQERRQCCKGGPASIPIPPRGFHAPLTPLMTPSDMMLLPTTRQCLSCL